MSYQAVPSVSLQIVYIQESLPYIGMFNMRYTDN